MKSTQTIRTFVATSLILWSVVFATVAHAQNDAGVNDGNMGGGFGLNESIDGGGCGDCGAVGENQIPQPSIVIDQGVNDHAVSTYEIPQTPVCPAGTTGVYPNCVTPPTTCPAGTSGIYPNCTPITYNPVCPSGTVGTYPNCYVPSSGCYHNCGGYYIPPTYYISPAIYPHYYPNQTPFVTLSSVPYTGLNLGFGGLVAYWSFLILLALFAAYLVIVVRVQNRVVGWLGGVLFGEASHTVDAHAVHAHPEHTAEHVHAAQAPALQEDIVDDFILSQVSRVR